MSLICFTIGEYLFFYPRDGLFKTILLQLALPDNDDKPAFCLQLTPDLLVSFLIPCDFRRPEISIGLGDSVILATLVAMPKTTMGKDYSAVLGKDDVGRTGKASIIHPIAESLTPECVTELQLRLCGRGVNGDHITMALVWRENVRHATQRYYVSG